MIDLIKLNTTGKVDFEIYPNLDNYTHDLIKKLENICAKGTIVYNGETYNLVMTITGKMILKSSINFSDVLRKINIEIDEDMDDLTEKYKKSTNLLDISPIIWENILLEIPIRATNEDDKFNISSGDGWEIL